LNTGALLQLADAARSNWSHDKDYILVLADRLCHINKNPNPNCKPVSGFQNVLKSTVAHIKNFPVEKFVSQSHSLY